MSKLTDMNNHDLALRVSNLKTYFYNDRRCNKAIDGVSFDIHKGKTLCVVGESGCGKSVTASTIMQLLPTLSRIESGEITYYSDQGEIRIDQLDRSGEKMRAIRGSEIAMIFQDPMTALNPAYTISFQIGEMLQYHTTLDKQQVRARTLQLLTDMGIPLPEQRIDEYPHQYSGGMRQRAMIAMALSTRPSLLIADEPTTALDVTIQAQVIDLMKDLIEEFGMGIVFITHDLGVIAQTADKVAVMYLGKLVEQGTVRDVIRHPAHPYTRGLLNALPKLDDLDTPLQPIPGDIPSPLERPTGCVFHTRCPMAEERCKQSVPAYESFGTNHKAACFVTAEQRVKP